MTSLLQTATRLLNDQGFDNVVSFRRKLADTFQKTYQTAVGPKAATIQIRERGGFLLLSGQYWSEGRNVLEACSGSALIRVSGAHPEFWILKYIADADNAVRNSYAARLV